MTTLPLTAITIDRNSRQRRELTGIEELAASIARIGLINPIVVTEDNILIAGERRHAACTLLGWTDVPVTIFSDLPLIEQRLIELEENVKREELNWRDHTAAIAEYHNLRLSENPEWTIAATAEELGMSKQHVSARLGVQEALEEGDELVVKADKYSVARGIVERKRQRRAAIEQEKVTDLAATFLPEPEPATEETASPEIDVTAIPIFLNKEFTSFIDEYQGPAFNLFHCDFPYGINADKHNQGKADAFGGYEDSPDVYWSLCKDLLRCIDKHAAPDFHILFWFSMDYYTETKSFFESAGLAVNPFPLYWFKSDNVGTFPDPKRGPRRVVETAFLVTGGDRHIVQMVSNCIAEKTTKEIHMSEKPKKMLAHYFRMLVDDTTRMLDPTSGSGNAVAVAHEMGAEIAIGVERDATFYSDAKRVHVR